MAKRLEDDIKSCFPVRVMIRGINAGDLYFLASSIRKAMRRARTLGFSPIGGKEIPFSEARRTRHYQQGIEWARNYKETGIDERETYFLGLKLK